MESNENKLPEISVNIILVFGIPGSGKSHTANLIKKRLQKDMHVCFALDYDLLESHSTERIISAQDKGLLEMFEQKIVYLYNPDTQNFDEEVIFYKYLKRLLKPYFLS